MNRRFSSSQIKLFLIIAFLVCSTVFAVIARNSAVIRAFYNRDFVSKPYSYPSQDEAEKAAKDIAKRLSSGDIQSVGKMIDTNAVFYFAMGMSNSVTKEEKKRCLDDFQSDLVGLKSCEFRKYISFKDGKHNVTFYLNYDNGKQKRAIAELFKNKYGVVGIALFAVLPDDSIVTDAWFQ